MKKLWKKALPLALACLLVLSGCQATPARFINEGALSLSADPASAAMENLPVVAEPVEVIVRDVRGLAPSDGILNIAAEFCWDPNDFEIIALFDENTKLTEGQMIEAFSISLPTMKMVLFIGDMSAISYRDKHISNSQLLLLHQVINDGLITGDALAEALSRGVYSYENGKVLRYLDEIPSEQLLLNKKREQEQAEYERNHYFGDGCGVEHENPYVKMYLDMLTPQFGEKVEFMDKPASPLEACFFTWMEAHGKAIVYDCRRFGLESPALPDLTYATVHNLNARNYVRNAPDLTDEEVIAYCLRGVYDVQVVDGKTVVTCMDEIPLEQLKREYKLDQALAAYAENQQKDNPHPTLSEKELAELQKSFPDGKLPSYDPAKGFVPDFYDALSEVFQ